ERRRLQLAFPDGDAHRPAAQSRVRACVRNGVAFARVKKFENAVPVLDIAPSLRRELAHEGVMIRYADDESTWSIDDAHFPVLRYFTRVEQLQKAAHSHRDGERAKWPAILEDRHIDICGPVLHDLAHQDVGDDDRAARKGEVLRAQGNLLSAGKRITRPG